MGEDEITDKERREYAKILTQRYGRVTVIAVESNPRAVIVKTTNVVSPLLRDSSGQVGVGGKTLVTVLTSGSIGKLKKRASRSPTTANGKVP